MTPTQYGLAANARRLHVVDGYVPAAGGDKLVARALCNRGVRLHWVYPDASGPWALCPLCAAKLPASESLTAIVDRLEAAIDLEPDTDAAGDYVSIAERSRRVMLDVLTDLPLDVLAAAVDRTANRRAGNG